MLDKQRRNILRRCPKPVRTSANSFCGSTLFTAGTALRRMSTIDDDTFGFGKNTVAGTSAAINASAQYEIFTLTAP